MKYFKFYLGLSIVILLSSCSSLKEGFSGQKKTNSDEFLVEKKSPLVMPPDYNELPIPKENVETETEISETDIKSLISKTKNDEAKKNLDEKSSSFEESMLKKIKKN
jgi:hypothetical protein